MSQHDSPTTKRPTLLTGAGLFKDGDYRGVEGLGAAPQTTKPLVPTALHEHVIQAIKERLDLGHLYDLTLDEDGHEASCRPDAAASVWRAVWDAVHNAGWRIVQNV